MHQVYSTLASNMLYTIWSKHDPESNRAEIEKQVYIKGGAGVATKQLVTPYSIMTEVDDSELEALELNQTFQLHVKNGFIKVMKRRLEADKVAQDMSDADASRPMTAKRFKEEAKKGRFGDVNVASKDV